MQKGAAPKNGSPILLNYNIPNTTITAAIINTAANSIAVNTDCTMLRALFLFMTDSSLIQCEFDLL